MSGAYRERVSSWPAISVDTAFKILHKVFNENIDDKRKVIVVDSNKLNCGSVLAENIFAQRYHPPFRASTKDGYAVLVDDDTVLRNVHNIVSYAEKDFKKLENFVLNQGFCVRVNTGSKIPDNANAVVQVEDTKLIKSTDDIEKVIEILKTPCFGQNIREVGSDIMKGDCLLLQNYKLYPADFGLIALSNVKEIRIFKPVYVSILSTGNELTDAVIDNNKNFAIIDTNRPILKSLFQSENFVVFDGGIVEDSKTKLKDLILNCLEKSTVLVVTGGVSMGDKDYLKSVLTELLSFKIHFGRVFMKPGLPTTFASGFVNQKPKFVFGLPGNPVSTFVTSQLYVIPFLRKLSGLKNFNHSKILVEIFEDIPLDNRPEYRCATFKFDANHTIINNLKTGRPLVQCLSNNQISSCLKSIYNTTLLLELPSQTSSCKILSKNSEVYAIVIEKF